jgi:hypothetical protein
MRAMGGATSRRDTRRRDRVFEINSNGVRPIMLLLENA